MSTEREPADAPGDRLVPARVTPGREHAVLEREARRGSRGRGASNAEVRRGP
jgi:hypothetical protein